MEHHRSARPYWDTVPRDKKGESPPRTHASIGPVHHLPHTSGPSWELEKCVSTADSHGCLACMVWQEKGRQYLWLMKFSAKLHPAVIYYLGKQGCDARQITGPAGGHDTAKAGRGGWDDEEEEEPPSATAAGDSSSAQQSLWGGFVTAGS